MREIIKKVLKEFTVNKSSLMHDLQVMDYDYEDAQEELKKHIDWFKSLPKEMMLYRIVYVDDESDINLKEPGSHYSLNKDELVENHQYVIGYGEYKYLITVTAKKSLFDAQETISNNILYPNEMEITLKNKGKGTKVISIEKL